VPAVSPSPASASTRLDVVAGPLRFSIAPTLRGRWERAEPLARRSQLEAWTSKRQEVTQRQIVARIRWTQHSLSTLNQAVTSTATSVRVTVSFDRIEIRLPRIRQVWRDNCETAALSMLLGGTPDQRTLQARLPVSAPLNPRSTSRGLVWGDPDQGFVGNARGGGYGVYEGPLLRLARKVGANLTNLSGLPFVQLANTLRSGRPVLSWVTLGPSSSRTWWTTRGHLVRADAAEHAVVLVGWKIGYVVYIDPWDGTRKVEDLPEFAARWRLLGQRAITLGQTP